jgi:hypothetical protein
LKYGIVICGLMTIAFCAGRFSHPASVKASSVPRIVHVEVSGDWAVVPGSDYGTPVSVSCAGNGDCYVLMQGK